MKSAFALAILAMAAHAATAGKPFGISPEGKPVELFTLRNANGMEATVMTWGATVVSLKVPDAAGHFDDVVLGFDNLEGYRGNNPYFGAIAGRYGNRIAHAKFVLHGQENRLKANNGENSLHGGERGFDKRVWTVEHADSRSATMRYISPDGEEGYPGTLTATVRYTVTARDELRIDYTATSDKATVQSLTNHSYFNLSGEGSGTILDEDIQIYAGRFTPVDASMIPTGELRSVAGTPLDFREPTRVGARIDADYDQLKLGGGYDHNWIIDRARPGLVPAARVHDPKSGRIMEVLTTQPGVQFYTANSIDGTIKGKGGKAYIRRGALCLETQHYPDSPNHPEFPSTELKPGETFHSTTVYRFSARKSRP